ncbi:MAG: hypothetical protein IEMM0008_1053 [bacterium]|nr:MAG: hypothetical protein IEMM0008_1053 [bacterium]
MSQDFNLIDQIIKKQDHEKLVTIKSILLKELPFLREHAFNDRIVVPAVLFLEMMAQNAKLLFPGHQLTKVNYIDFKGILTLKEDIETKVITETVCSELNNDSAVIEGTIYYELMNQRLQMKRKRVIARFEAILKPDDYLGEQENIFPFFPVSDLVIEKEDIYPDLVGIGESFNQLDSVLQLSSKKGITGQLIKRDTGENQVYTDSYLLGDLFIRDSAYHLASIFGNHVVGGFNIPFYMSDIHFNKSLRDKSYFCTAHVLEHTDTESAYSLKIVDDEGSVVESYGRISYTYKVGILGDPVVEGKIIKRMERIRELEDLKKAIQQHVELVAIWSVTMIEKIETFLKELLTNDEIVIYNKYLRKKSRLDFLGGRILSKLNILYAMNKWPATRSDFTDLNIKRTENGSPELHIKESITKPFFSISHKTNYIFCASQTHGPLGIDLEEISERLIKVKKKYVSKGEEEILLSCSRDSANLYPSLTHLYTALWASKEAIIKYLNKSFYDIANNAILTKVEKNKFYFIYDQNGCSLPLKTVHFTYSNYVFSVITGEIDGEKSSN